MKLKASISALVFVATIGLATAQNQSQEKGQHAKNTQKSTAFIDKNNNGVCDNFENGTPRNAYANGKQTLRNKLEKNRMGAIGRGHRQGSCSRLRNGKGREANFIDNNNNGVCDRREKNS